MLVIEFTNVIRAFLAHDLPPFRGNWPLCAARVNDIVVIWGGGSRRAFPEGLWTDRPIYRTATIYAVRR